MNASLKLHQRGLSYVEILIAITLVVAALVPMLEALRTPVGNAGRVETENVRQLHITTRLTELLAESFSELDAAALAAGSHNVTSSFSEPPGTTNRRLVFLSRFDGDNADADNDSFTGTDADLLWIRITIENTAHELQRLRSR